VVQRQATESRKTAVTWQPGQSLSGHKIAHRGADMSASMASEKARLGTLDAVLALGKPIFSLAIIAFGVITLVSAHVVGQPLGPGYNAIPTIPWVPAIPWVAYVFGLIWIACGAGLFFKRSALAATYVVGTLMVFFALFVIAPRNADVMSAGWRTVVLEPMTIAALGWLMLGKEAIPNWLYQAARIFVAFALIIFGWAHFQVLGFIAGLIPNWIPFHSFWVALFGVAFVAAGLSFASGYLQRWAAIGTGLMFAIWVITLHIPRTLGFYNIPGAIHDPDEWSSLFIAVALWGGFWAVATTLTEGHQVDSYKSSYSRN
jgi:uncharacterized membrane protein YphA (DoxX/SURF4 family)